MNERIKELADESARYSAIMALPTGQSGNELFVEKFTQLIVMECADIADKAEPYKANDLIKQHFGVKS